MNDNTYKIEHKITTLAQNAVPNKKNGTYHTFTVNGITLEHWDFDIRGGWIGDAWLAKGQEYGNSFVDALNSFSEKLKTIIPRISLVSQSYIEYQLEPFLVYKHESDIAFFRYVEDVPPCGLMFMEKEKQALDEMLSSTAVPNEFYLYWNDATNTLGYSAKLLLMFSAIEALAKRRDKTRFKKPYDLYANILGDELTQKIFEKNTGLRNRLVHGEYLSSEQDGGTNYMELIHKKIVSYFNSEILSQHYLNGVVVDPQRHFYGRKSIWPCFIKRIGKSSIFDLKSLLKEVSSDGIRAEFIKDANYKPVEPGVHNHLLETY